MNSISSIKETVSDLGKQYGAERIYLFGSYARGEATEQSDIDLRIDRGTIHGLQFAKFLGDLEDKLGKNVDLISTAGMDKDFLSGIKNEEILLYERQ